MKACPVNCDPSAFISLARNAQPSDYQLSAAEILSMNPFGGTCGVVCPDKFCMEACSRSGLDEPISIPAVQATIIKKAADMGLLPQFGPVKSLKDHRVAVVGGGPSGLSCAAVLARLGYRVTVFEKRNALGGALHTIPPERLPRHVIENDLKFISSLSNIDIQTTVEVKNIEALRSDFDAICVSGGLEGARRLNIENESLGVEALDFLRNPKTFSLGPKVAIIGGGAVAVDVATTAKRMKGVKDVFIFYRRGLSDMPLSKKEREELFTHGIQVVPRVLPVALKAKEDDVTRLGGLVVNRVDMSAEKSSSSSSVSNSAQHWDDITSVIFALGNEASWSAKEDLSRGVFLAGDFAGGASTVVQSCAYGKNVAENIHQYLLSKDQSAVRKAKDMRKSVVKLDGYNFTPIDLTTDFFGIRLNSPFLLSASPVTDGYDQVKKAYEAGWAGAIMKTAFDNISIHIPNHYMCKFDENTYGNADNVSGHNLDRVCSEIARLRQEFPDRVTMASTGGPVTGNDESDRIGWVKNTVKLESAGAQAVEYSLSCPQGGDGTKGSIVSQNAELSAKIIDWVLSGCSKPEVPKLFKLTGAVTSIAAILIELKKVFDKHSANGRKGGITLANSFPGMTFRKGSNKKEWEEGIVVGMSGEGITPISYLNLAGAAPFGLSISGNGGPFSYTEAANFLALGCKTVQFCTLPTRRGVEIVSELNSGLSHMMRSRGMKSMSDLIGVALPHPITDFMALTPVKQMSAVIAEQCVRCGNCTRCPYLAISMDPKFPRLPITDPSKCIGCGFCVQNCPALALYLRNRTPEEAKSLKED